MAKDKSHGKLRGFLLIHTYMERRVWEK